jgi:H+/gluconate symporter-like permease
MFHKRAQATLPFIVLILSTIMATFFGSLLPSALLNSGINTTNGSVTLTGFLLGILGIALSVHILLQSTQKKQETMPTATPETQSHSFREAMREEISRVRERRTRKRARDSHH